MRGLKSRMKCLKILAQKNGALVLDDNKFISGKTDLVVVEGNGLSKETATQTKARKLGVKTITEDGFVALIHSWMLGPADESAKAHHTTHTQKDGLYSVKTQVANGTDLQDCYSLTTTIFTNFTTGSPTVALPMLPHAECFHPDDPSKGDSDYIIVLPAMCLGDSPFGIVYGCAEVDFGAVMRAAHIRSSNKDFKEGGSTTGG